jgi:hypothetical protein
MYRKEKNRLLLLVHAIADSNLKKKTFPTPTTTTSHFPAQAASLNSQNMHAEVIPIIITIWTATSRRFSTREGIDSNKVLFSSCFLA